MKSIERLALEGQGYSLIFMLKEQLYVVVYTLTVCYDLSVCQPAKVQKHAKQTLSLIQGIESCSTR